MPLSILPSRVDIRIIMGGTWGLTLVTGGEKERMTEEETIGVGRRRGEKRLNMTRCKGSCNLPMSPLDCL